MIVTHGRRYTQLYAGKRVGQRWQESLVISLVNLPALDECDLPRDVPLLWYLYEPFAAPPAPKASQLSSGIVGE
jgi:hypothetical protein